MAVLYGATARHILPRGGTALRTRLGSADDRLVFVVGSPRSGTTMLGQSLGSAPGFVDLGEVAPLKAALPDLAGLPEDEASRRLRHVLERTRGLALVRGLRGVEQTPEMAFLVGAGLRAYPRARVVHIVRDGRDVACSLLERGWLSAGHEGHDDAHLLYGAQARFWVELGRAQEFEHASDATRAAWAWRRYVSAARQPVDRVLELRYEQLVADPGGAAALIATHIDAPREALAEALTRVHDRSVGRHRHDLSAEQLTDIEREAGDLLGELGYR